MSATALAWLPGQHAAALVEAPSQREAPPLLGCPACRVGRPDACLSGGFREYGIKDLRGFARPALILPAAAIVPLDGESGAVGVLAEPPAVVEKAVELATNARRRLGLHGDERWNTLVVGCGSVGLLATALLRLRGHAVTAVDRRPSTNSAARIATALGATYQAVDGGDALGVLGDARFDCVFEASGDSATALAVHEHLAAGGVQVQIGVAAGARSVTIDADRRIRDDVARQLQVIGTASASREHLARAVADLPLLLALPQFRSIVTGQHAPEDFNAALWPGPEAIKTVLTFDADRA